MEFKRFQYGTLSQLADDIQSGGYDIPISQNLSVFSRRPRLKGIALANSLITHPMEGSDALADGAPGPLTLRRYDRFARGGAGLIWFEAVAVSEDGKAAANQLAITEKNVEAFRQLRSKIRESALQAGEQEPVVLLQLTHSGRYARPWGEARPVIAYHNPVLDTRMQLDPALPVVTDDYLKTLEETYVAAARLAREAGFDGVDLKACHRYLISELLSAYDRPGAYGGSFENRTRFLCNIMEGVSAALPGDFIIGCRLNLYDGIRYPYGFGCDRENGGLLDMSEPERLVSRLRLRGLSVLNATMGTPYFNPHVNRPFDHGNYVPPEHPLEGVARLINGIGQVQRANPELLVAGTGYSWLREFGPNVGAGVLEQGRASLIGFGRQSIAYPAFARDILSGGLKKEKCCISCGKCAELLRAGGPTGCVVRDRDTYGEHYRRLQEEERSAQ